MRYLVIEDERYSFNRLKTMLQCMDASAVIDGPISSVEGTRKHLLQDSNYDAIFSDIRLDDGDVFEAFLQVPVSVPVVFTTAYNEFALEAFKTNGIAYLLKPFAQVELEKAVELVKKISLGNVKEPPIGDKLRQIFPGKGERKRFLVKEIDGFRIVPITDVNHISVDDNGVRAYLNNGKSVPLSITMKDLELELPSPQFFRVNRQNLVNIDSVEKLENTIFQRFYIKLKHYPHTHIAVSKERIAAVREWLDK